MDGHDPKCATFRALPTKAADNRTPEQNELIELRKRNRQLEMEVDVLKQAALIFARK